MFNARRHPKGGAPIPVPVILRDGIPVPVHNLIEETELKLQNDTAAPETGHMSYHLVRLTEGEPAYKRQKFAPSVETVSIALEPDLGTDPQEEQVESYEAPTDNTEFVDFNIGDRFDSYDAFMDKLEMYKYQNCVDFVKRDARTIASVSRRLTRVFREGLMYYEVNMRCVHGGQVLSRAKTNRRTRESLKMGCPAFISLRSTSDGMFLEVKSLKLEHNHQLDMDIIRNRGTTKKLPKAVRKRAQEMLAANVDKEVVEQMIARETGEVDTKRIVTNLLALAVKSEKQTVLNRVFEKLQHQNDGVIDYFPEKYELKGILFQDTEMRSYLESYPEIITVISSGRMCERACSYVILAEDGLGHPGMVGFGVLASEKEPNFVNLLELFKMRNPFLVDRLRVILTNRDETTVDYVKTIFPQAVCFLTGDCVERSMKRAINSMRLTEDQKSTITGWLEQFLTVSCDSDYSSLYSRFSEAMPKFLDYFNEKWHGIISSWVLGITFRTFEIMPDTIQWMTLIVNGLIGFEPSEVETYVDQIFTYAQELRRSRQARFAEIALEQPNLDLGLPRKVEDSFAEVLTPYACKYVEAQTKVPEVELMQTESNDTFQADTWEGIVTVSAQSCTCIFHRHLGLPCAHIFACRHHLGLGLFEETLYDYRWTLKYMKENNGNPKLNELLAVSSERWDCGVLVEGEPESEQIEEEIGMDEVTIVDLGDVETS